MKCINDRKIPKTSEFVSVSEIEMMKPLTVNYFQLRIHFTIWYISMLLFSTLPHNSSGQGKVLVSDQKCWHQEILFWSSGNCLRSVRQRDWCLCVERCLLSVLRFGGIASIQNFYDFLQHSWILTIKRTCWKYLNAPMCGKVRIADVIHWVLVCETAMWFSDYDL